MVHFCAPPCGQKIEYKGIKPKECPYCGAPTNALAAFKPIVSAPSTANAQTSQKTASSNRRTDRWEGTSSTARRASPKWGENDAQASAAQPPREVVDMGEELTFEDLGLDQHSFGAKVVGDDNPVMTVQSLRESNQSFGGRPSLSPEEAKLKAEALKDMLGNGARVAR